MSQIKTFQNETPQNETGTILASPCNYPAKSPPQSDTGPGTVLAGDGTLARVLQGGAINGPSIFCRTPQVLLQCTDESSCKGAV
jgi:hypothetical protein